MENLKSVTGLKVLARTAQNQLMVAEIDALLLLDVFRTIVV